MDQWLVSQGRWQAVIRNKFTIPRIAFQYASLYIVRLTRHTSMDISSEMISHQLSQRTAFNTENPGLTLKLIKPVIPSCLYKQPNVTAKQYPCNYHDLPPIRVNRHAGLSCNKANACKGRCFLYAYKYILELDICDLHFWFLYKTSQCSDHCVL